MPCRTLEQKLKLTSIRLAPVILPPRVFIGVVLQMWSGYMMMDALLASADSTIEALNPVCMNAVHGIPVLAVIDGFEVGVIGIEDVPMRSLVGSDLGLLGHVLEN